MTDTPVLTSDVVRTFTEAWHYMSSQYRDNLQTRDGPVRVTMSNTNCSFLNIVTIDSPLADEAELREALTVARRYADDCPHEAMLLVCPEWLPDDAQEAIENAGLAFSMPMWGMAADRLAPPRREPPALDFRLAEDTATGRDLGTVNADAYGMAHEFFCVTEDLPGWRGKRFGIVGYDDDRAVTSTLAYPLGEEIYVAWVATLPGLHGKGYAEAAMRRAIADAQSACGEGRLWLHATEMGRPLYTAMGFATGAEMHLYNFTDEKEEDQ